MLIFNVRFILKACHAIKTLHRPATSKLIAEIKKTRSQAGNDYHYHVNCYPC